MMCRLAFLLKAQRIVLLLLLLLVVALAVRVLSTHHNDSFTMIHIT
jgi:hypothetical protein